MAADLGGEIGQCEGAVSDAERVPGAVRALRSAVLLGDEAGDESGSGRVAVSVAGEPFELDVGDILGTQEIRDATALSRLITDAGGAVGAQHVEEEREEHCLAAAVLEPDDRVGGPTFDRQVELE